MAHGLEIRVPFLHLPLVEWAQAQGPGLRRYPKQALLQAVGDLLPPECRNRPKQGFELPFSTWLTGPLRGQFEAMFAHPPIPALSQRFLTSLWQVWLHRPGQVGWARVWSLYALLHWMSRHHVEYSV
jgi:asparagine synthase (glutamine-hydrolysing)